MGAVYLASHATRGTQAIKLIVPRAAISRGISDAFKRELSACTVLQHANIVRVFDQHAASAGTFWASMEFVPGPSIEELLRANPRGVEPQYPPVPG
jgi:serine/threonine protein kinase